ncbi:hypothetical protein [Paraflavitalea speifideaquila]|uniref:hypothetical protein n=1 Tax=Paraflavitalea speifideaquila TaxID=3076558 RepID=UPI0028EC925C|nr:hypothetical protein [Paraflavitalea speifideiaquila]
MRTTCQVMLREWKRIFRLPVHYLVLLVAPPILFLLYAYIYNEQQVERLPMALWDDDQSALSRQFTFLLQQGKTCHFTTQVSSIDELEDLIQKEKYWVPFIFLKRWNRISRAVTRLM